MPVSQTCILPVHMHYFCHIQKKNKTKKQCYNIVCIDFSQLIFILIYLYLKGNYRRGKDGRRVRRGDDLPPHRYIRNTSIRGTAPIEHPLNAGRRRQTSQKARNSPHTWVGQKKKEKTETKE